MKEQSDGIKKESIEIPKEQEFDNFRMYHQLQYDRIDKLESRRENFSNFVITISAGIYLIGFENLTNLNLVTGLFLPIMVIVVNIAAIIFTDRSRHYVKMHQNRARIARGRYAPQLNEISSQVKKRNSDDDFFRRNRIYKYLHISIIIIALLSILSFYQQKNENSEVSNDSSKNEKVEEIKTEKMVNDSIN